MRALQRCGRRGSRYVNDINALQPQSRKAFPAARLKIEEPAFLNSSNNRQTNRRLVIPTTSASLPLGCFYLRSMNASQCCAGWSGRLRRAGDGAARESPDVTVFPPPPSLRLAVTPRCAASIHAPRRPVTVASGKAVTRQTDRRRGGPGRAGPRFLLSGFLLSGAAAGPVPGRSCGRAPCRPQRHLCVHSAGKINNAGPWLFYLVKQSAQVLAERDERKEKCGGGSVLVKRWDADGFPQSRHMVWIKSQIAHRYFCA